jgi:hypothetical protein
VVTREIRDTYKSTCRDKMGSLELWLGKGAQREEKPGFLVWWMMHSEEIRYYRRRNNFAGED